MISSIGGERGWLFADWAWELRGWLDLLVGGVGMRRFRRDQYDLVTGDALDFWRVEAVEPGRLLRLRAEMKAPGSAWLQFVVTPRSGGGTVLQLNASFAPRGLAGLAYWYSLLPIHLLLFYGLARAIARGAELHAAS